jgi:diamine N-acetyltransferase
LSAHGEDWVIVGERVALGPLRRDLLETYTRWVNDPQVKRGLDFAGLTTVDSEGAWYDEAAKASGAREPTAAHFTIYDRSDRAPVGTTALMGISWRDRAARFGILVGERRGQGLGTEATRLTLDWAFNVLALYNVMLEAADWNAGAIRAYERAGFRLIGRRRGVVISPGQRSDEVLMDAVADEFSGSVLPPLTPERGSG